MTNDEIVKLLDTIALLSNENVLLRRQLEAALERGHQEICYDDIYDESGLIVGRAGVVHG